MFIYQIWRKKRAKRSNISKFLGGGDAEVVGVCSYDVLNFGPNLSLKLLINMVLIKKQCTWGRIKTQVTGHRSYTFIFL